MSGRPVDALIPASRTIEHISATVFLPLDATVSVVEEEILHGLRNDSVRRVRPRRDDHVQPAGAAERHQRHVTARARRGLGLVRDDPEIRVAIITGAGDRAFSRRPGHPGHRRIGHPQQGARLAVCTTTSGSRSSAPSTAWSSAGGFIRSRTPTSSSLPNTSRSSTRIARSGMCSRLEPVGLLRRMPLSMVMQLGLMTKNGRITAQRGYDIGLVNEVVAEEQLHAAAARSRSTSPSSRRQRSRHPSGRCGPASTSVCGRHSTSRTDTCCSTSSSTPTTAKECGHSPRSANRNGSWNDDRRRAEPALRTRGARLRGDRPEDARGARRSLRRQRLRGLHDRRRLARIA